MLADLLLRRLAVHNETVTPQLLAQCAAERDRISPFPVHPAHGMVLADPSLVLERGDDLSLIAREFRNRHEIHGPVRIEAVNGVQIPVKRPRAVYPGKLVFERGRGEFLLGFLRRSTLGHIPRVQRHGKIVQMQEAAAREISVLARTVDAAECRLHLQKRPIEVHDLFDIRNESRGLARHIAVGFEPRLLTLPAGQDPGIVFSVIFVDLSLIVLIVVIDGADISAGKIKVHVHGVQLRARAAAVGFAVPALKLVAEHQHPRQRMQLHGKRSLALFRILVIRDREFEHAVVDGDGRERVEMHLRDTLRPAGADKLAQEPDRAEYRVVHKVPVAFGTRGFVLHDETDVILGETVRRSEAFCDCPGEQAADAVKAPAGQFFQPDRTLALQRGKLLHAPVCEVRTVHSSFQPIHLKV